jgi:hypothetical protein
MYQILMRVNRYGAIVLAALWFVSLLLPGMQEVVGVDTLQGLQLLTTALAAMVFADKPLARLSFAEISAELAHISLEDATEKFWKEEEKRRRDEDKRK